MFIKFAKYSPIIFVFLALFWLQPAQAAGWVQQSPGSVGKLYSVDVYNVTSANTFLGIAVGSGGAILKTTDGGATWISKNWSQPVMLRDIDIVSQNIAYVVGDGGVILKTYDGGDTWSQLTSGVTTDLKSVSFSGYYTGFAVGGNDVLKTTNGGSSWTKQTIGEEFSLTGVSISQNYASVAWIVGDSNYGSSGLILKTVNGGINWSTQGSGVAINPLYDVLAYSGTTAWAVGTQGIMLKTIDGQNWTTVSSGSGQHLISIDVMGLSGFAVGSSDNILKTTNNSDWVSAPTNFSQPQYWHWYGVAVTDSPDMAWAVGVQNNSGKIAIYDAVAPIAPNALSRTTPDSNNTPNFSWHPSTDSSGAIVGTGVVKYEYAIDGGAYINNGSNLTVTLSAALANGPHAIQVRAVDAAGNVGDYAYLVFTINATTDIDPPTIGSVSINNGATTTNSTSVTLNLSCTDNVSCVLMQVAVDGTADTESWGIYLANPSAALSSGDGTKIVAVRFKDGAGNVSAQYTDTIVLSTAVADTVAPTGSISINNNASATNSANATLNFTCADTFGCVQMQISIDGVFGAWETFAASKTINLSSADGLKQYGVKFKDAAGNVSIAYNSSIILDTVTQDTIIAQKPSAATTDSSATFTFGFSGSAVSSVVFECKLDTGVFSSCDNPKSYGNLSVGSHTFQARAVDAAGNVDATPASYTWTIASSGLADTSAPYVSSITPTTAQATVAQSFTVSYSDAVGVISCNLYVDSVDQGPMTPAGTTVGTASRVYTFINTASHTLQARCSDAAGNVGLGALTTVSVSAAPAAAADTIAPSAPAGAQKISNDADATPTFIWNTANDNVGATNYLIQIDNGSLIDNGGSTTYTVPGNLASGSHALKILAKDAAGNTSSVATYNFIVNTGAAAVSCPLTMEKAYKSSASKAVYYITTDCAKRPFKNGPSFFTYFDSWSEVITTTKTILDSIANDPLGFTPAGPKYDPKYGALVKIVTDPKVYLLLGTEKYWIISESVFTGLKYDWKWIEDVDPGLLNKYSIGSEITYTDHHPNYTIVKYAGFANTYRLEPDPDDYSKQVKRWIKNEKVFNALKFRWDRIVAVPNSEVYKDGKVMDESEVNL